MRLCKVTTAQAAATGLLFQQTQPMTESLKPGHITNSNQQQTTSVCMFAMYNAAKQTATASQPAGW